MGASTVLDRSITMDIGDSRSPPVNVISFVAGVLAALVLCIVGLLGYRVWLHRSGRYTQKLAPETKLTETQVVNVSLEMKQQNRAAIAEAQHEERVIKVSSKVKQPLSPSKVASAPPRLEHESTP